MPNAKTYHHGNLRPALIQAGLAILAESGLAGLTLRSCAERVGVSHAAPKNHFGNLEGLRTAIAAQGYAELLEYARRDAGASATRLERRDAALEGYIAFAVAHPALYELMFSQGLIDGEDAELKAQLSACFGLLREISINLDWDKADAPDAVLRAQIMFWSFVHGFAQLSLAGRLGKDSMKGFSVLDILPALPYREER